MGQRGEPGEMGYQGDKVRELAHRQDLKYNVITSSQSHTLLLQGKKKKNVLRFKSQKQSQLLLVKKK